MASDPVARPRTSGTANPNGIEGRPTKEQVERLRGLKAWRNERGEELDLDPALIWPMQSLERLARDAFVLDDETDNETTTVRRWQAREFADSLRESLEKWEE